METLLPGLWRDMEAAGTRRTDVAADWAWYHYGVWKNRQPSGLTMYCQTRPFLEWHVRQRVRALANVELRDRSKVSGFLHDSSGKQVTGVSVRQRGEHSDCEERATLVVDCSGRGTRAPQWLEQLGYGRAAVEEVRTDVGYSSRIVRLRDDPTRDWQVMMVYPRAPRQTRVGYIFPVEDGCHIITLAGYCGDYPPTDEDGFHAFARSLPRPEYAQALEGAEVLTEIIPHRLPSNLRRRYEQMDRFPDGLVILGDAICSFNPLFGQGMTTAAKGAEALATCLDRHAGGDIRGLARTFQKQTVPYNDLAWTLATTEDMRYLEVSGKRPIGLAALNWYKNQLLELASVDPDLNRRFLAVLTFTRGLSEILAPSVIVSCLRYGLSRRRQANVAQLSALPRRPVPAS
ncbi:MAG: hypothetical protein AAGC55_17925 [Myxococcota bacterium]